MNQYSVMVLYPEYATSDYGGDYYFAHTEADNAFEAARNVQRMASEANDLDIDAAGFRPIAVFSGAIELALGALDFGDPIANDFPTTTTEDEITEIEQDEALRA
jgi:hypothetical protein